MAFASTFLRQGIAVAVIKAQIVVTGQGHNGDVLGLVLGLVQKGQLQSLWKKKNKTYL